jgi:Transcriptional regulator, AbiEi antitoxin/REase_MTES_1575
VLAERQHGVVSRRQLLAIGYSDAAITRAAGAGRLHRVHRGVYAVGYRRLSRRGHCLAAVLACGAGATLSHSSAAWLWGLIPNWPATAHVSIPSRGKSRHSIRVHHAPALTDGDRSLRDAIPVTAVPRTLLDLSSLLPSRQLDRAIERSDQLGLFDLRAVEVLLARTAGHPGWGRLGHALATYREPAFTRSELERRFLDLVREAGLPVPSANAFVAGYEIDMYWSGERFAVELNGYEYHRTRAAFERDRLRQEELKLAGIDSIRITARRVERDPESVVTRLATLLDGRRRQLG